MTMSKAEQARREEDRQWALERLHRLLKPGDTVFTVFRGRSASGMTRWYDLYVYRLMDGSKREAEPFRLTGLVARVLPYRYNERREALEVGGCGFDGGFELVHGLSYALHGMESKGDGAKPENSGRPFKARPGHFKAGYSLNHRSQG